MGITREEIETEGWMGDQRARVRELLDRAERAEARLAKALRLADAVEIYADYTAEVRGDSLTWDVLIARLKEVRP